MTIPVEMPFSNASRWLESSLLRLLIAVISIRIVVTAVALLGANVLPLEDGVVPGLEEAAARRLPGVWARWDSGYYLTISTEGYPSSGPETGFLPMYPALIRLVSSAVPLLGPQWSGVLLSHVLFLVAVSALWVAVRSEYGEGVAAHTVLLLSVFPTSLFFSAIYSESLFLACSAGVYLASRRKQYVVAALLAGIASVTRVTGALLILIPLIELLSTESRARMVQALRVLGVLAVAGVPVLGYAGYALVRHGSSVIYFTAQREDMHRSVTPPWDTLLDSLRVVFGHSEAYAANWFMRLVSVQDLLAILLFLICAAFAAKRLRPSLAAYLGASVMFLTVSHGPGSLGVFSDARYVLPLFPGFMILAMWLNAAPSWLRWSSILTSLALLALYTIWFASGRWVA